MAITIIDCSQGSAEWFQARLGIPTASRFATVMARGEGKTRDEYLRKLAGEILTGEPMENYQNADMIRGHEQEDEARNTYAMMTDAEIIRVGFIRNGNRGCSPDSLVGVNAGLEIKTAAAHIQIDRLIKDRLPPEHKAQVQGNIWLSERECFDFVSYNPKLPIFIKRVWRDDAYIATLESEVDRFNEELAQLVERIRQYGLEVAA